MTPHRVVCTRCGRFAAFETSNGRRCTLCLLTDRQHRDDRARTDTKEQK